jgi:hypothetical protein
MCYQLSKGYRWYKTPETDSIVLMYFINGMVYSYDTLSRISQDDPEIVLDATANHVYTEDEVYWASFYLLEEQSHPLLFELNLKNPELLPAD